MGGCSPTDDAWPYAVARGQQGLARGWSSWFTMWEEQTALRHAARAIVQKWLAQGLNRPQSHRGCLADVRAAFSGPALVTVKAPRLRTPRRDALGTGSSSPLLASRFVFWCLALHTPALFSVCL